MHLFGTRLRPGHAFVSAAIVAVCGTALAAPAPEADVTIGSLGGALQVGFALSPSVAVRLDLNGFKRNFSKVSEGQNYDGKLKLQTGGFLADWHPWQSSFRVTAGLYSNQNKLDMNATPDAAGNYTFNGTTYTAAQVGTAGARVDFRSAAPYLGFGWGHGGSDSGLQFTSDIGVIGQGAPRVQVNVSGAANNPALASNVQAAQVQLQSDLNSFRYYPVIQLGIGYRF